MAVSLYAPIDDIRHEQSDSTRRRAKTNGRANQDSANDFNWLSRCATDAKGNPIPNLANAMIALRSHPAVRDAFAYDEMLCAATLVRAIPKEGSKFTPRPITDIDVSI